jgi:hypothetical protein
MTAWLVILLFVVALGAGCASWHRSPLTPERQLAEEPGNRTLRVGLKDGRHVDLEGAHVVGDSLIGTAPVRQAPGSRVRPVPRERATVALADIQDLQVSKHAVWKSFGLGVLFVLGGLLIVALAVGPLDYW